MLGQSKYFINLDISTATTTFIAILAQASIISNWDYCINL